jgi:hypothetical protein
MTTVWVGDVDHLRPGRFYFYFQNASTFASLHVCRHRASGVFPVELPVRRMAGSVAGRASSYSEVGQICHQKSPFVITGVELI